MRGRCERCGKRMRNSRAAHCSVECAQEARASAEETIRARNMLRSLADDERRRRLREYQNTRRSKDKLQSTARRAVQRAVKSGKLTKPRACPVCKRRLPAKLIHGHHEDYNRPLDVRWMCQRCHAAEHRWAKARAGPR